MSDSASGSGASAASPEPDALQMLEVDSTAGSGLHKLYGSLGRNWPVPKLYAVVVAVTFVPLLIAAFTGPPPLFVQSLPTLKLPFFQDWNVLFDFLVSFPCIVIFAATDQHVLAHSLKSVQLDGTLTVSAADATLLSARWRRRFRITNIGGQAIAVAVGALLAWINYGVYVPEKIGYWIARNGHLVPAGYVFLYCIFLLFAVITFYICRSIAVALLLRDIVAHARLRPLPLHPDKSGGLRPIGRLGLRNQYVLMLIGVNIVLFITVSIVYLTPQGSQLPASLYALIIAAVVAYLILGPVVFVVPLLPFRAGMLKAKTELMAEVAQRLRVELQRMLSQLKAGTITQEDEELIDRLRKVDAVIEELPVWPFDAATLRKFFVAYGIPILTSAGYPLIKSLLDFVQAHFH